MYTIKFYETESGRIPLEEFLDHLPKVLNAKALRDMNILSEKGPEIRMPHSRLIRNGLFELRVSSGNDAIRIFYFFWVKDTIVLTNGYVKKTQKLSVLETMKAMRYKKDYERRCL